MAINILDKMKKMKIAIPTENGKLCAHFGHCEKFAVFTTEGEKIVNEEFITPPPHEPGSHPRFLRDLGVNIIIAGGMGNRAQSLFTQNNIQVYYGVPAQDLKELVRTCISNELKSGENFCDH